MESNAKRPPEPPPLPPPLASQKANPINEKSPVRLTVQDVVGNASLGGLTHVSMAEEPKTPVWYFFYKTLMEPSILKRILDTEEEPLLRPAKTTGYETLPWGQYRALVRSTPESELLGFAYEVQTAEHASKLARYETNAYKLEECQIVFTDENEPREAVGNTFMYAGDAEALRTGRFDRVLWELGMNMQLPDKWKMLLMKDHSSKEGS
ncbi:hypothetical protein F5Y16DRAFT_356266 [Xylariaceae sp. FL0255]|nr:hypothetical protein F5Y16DRAFT_356266 [Xylariaceae sp. FL0255]